MNVLVRTIGAAVVSLITAFMPGEGTSATAETRVALVIGNSNYTAVSSLVNPKNDATDIAAALDTAGFAVDLRIDLSWADLHQVLRDFQKRAASADVALIYYAGHGIEVGGKNYVIPVDAHLKSSRDVDFEAVPLDLIMKAAEGAGGLRLVILDACRNNPFIAQMRTDDGPRAIGRGLGKIEPTGNTLVAYAAREGTLAADGTGRNSPYATALKLALVEPGLEIGKLFRKVRDDVLRATGGEQEPFLYGSLSERDFFFIAPRTATDDRAGDRGDTRPVVTGPIRRTGPGADAFELEFWTTARETNSVRSYQLYLERYPDGAFAPLARLRLANVAGGNERGNERDPIDRSTDDRGGPPEVTTVDPLQRDMLVERELRLARRARREIQRRLTLIGHSTRGADGVFGRNTRAAISAWQSAQRRDVTGYLSADQIDLLKRLSQTKYAAWKARARTAAPVRRDRKTGWYFDARGCLHRPDGAKVVGAKHC